MDGLLTLGVLRASGKENEKRVPVHPRHFDRIDADLRASMLVESGYGLSFGVSDAELVPQVVADDPAPSVENAQIRVAHLALAPAVDIAIKDGDAVLLLLDLYPLRRLEAAGGGMRGLARLALEKAPFVPLAAVVFYSLGRHPLAGLAAAFAGVSGGYSANLLIGTVDPLLSGITTEAAQLIDPGYDVDVSANWYFMIASTFLITAIGSFVSLKIVEPSLGPYKGTPANLGEEDSHRMDPLTAREKKGLWRSLWATLIFAALIAAMVVPESGILRNQETGAVAGSPFLKGIVAIIFFYGVGLGVAYGVGAGTVRSDRDVIKGMSQQMSTLGGYMVLVFFAAQFVAFFNWTNLGLIFAVEGAQVLKSAGLHQVPLLLTFILLSAIINLVMGSASAKWALMAPVFIPMFMLLGYPPELIQIAYRVGDSVTNVISPMMSYFALIIAFVQRYVSKAGIGTLVSLMLPYSITFLIGWSIMFVIWLSLGLPVGPGAPTTLNIGAGG